MPLHREKAAETQGATGKSQIVALVDVHRWVDGRR
jgi:hypothetical protein